MQRQCNKQLFKKTKGSFIKSESHLTFNKNVSGKIESTIHADISEVLMFISYQEVNYIY